MSASETEKSQLKSMPEIEKESKTFEKLGIIAGGGRLPAMLIEACRKKNMEPYVLAFKSHTDTDLVKNVRHSWTSLGALQKNINILKSEKINDLVFCGDIKRPSIREMKPDIRAAKFFAFNGFKALGDNDLLSAIKGELAKDGFTLHGVHEFIEDIVAPAGLLGTKKPSEQDLKDIDLGIKASQEIGRLDIGQSVIIQEGSVIGVEAVEGTDELIKRSKSLLKDAQSSGVLVKTCKPQQDKNLDLPTIGIKTVENAVQAGLAGIAFHAGNSLIIDVDAVITLADEKGLFLYGVEL